MKQFYFFIGFIWPLASIGSLFIGPFVGLDRSKLKRELINFWNPHSESKVVMFARRLTLIFSWVGFLFPVVFQLFGFAVGLGFFALFALT
jgi:hypothetical protein